MKLQTKIVLGFSAVVLMTMVLGVASYFVTENMNRFALQSYNLE